MILIAVAAGVWASLAGYRAASYAESPVQLSSTAVAVFPFTVKAAEEFAFLSEGMMDLLSLKLDGAGEVRRVDPPHRLESISTSSSLALKYYLEGESLLRAGKYAVAIGAFKKATNEDSTFAIHTTVLPMPALLKPDSGQREELHSRRLQNMQSRCHGAIAIY